MRDIYSAAQTTHPDFISSETNFSKFNPHCKGRKKKGQKHEKKNTLDKCILGRASPLLLNSTKKKNICVYIIFPLLCGKEKEN
jgi:hypothetical protein